MNTQKSNNLNGKPNLIAGWNDYIQDKRQVSLFWHFLWKENGSPHHGYIANISRKTRAEYHYAIRSLLKQQTKIKSEKMAESISHNMTRDFWREVKRMKHSTKSTAMSIDGCNVDTDILDIFKTKYNDLYNSVPYDFNKMNKIKKEIDDSIESNPIVLKINVVDVRNAINHLKKDKICVIDGITSNCFLNGTNKLDMFLSLLFNAILIHGTVIENMNLGIMSPISKGKKCNDSKSDNYRAIVLYNFISDSSVYIEHIACSGPYTLL